MKRAMSTVDFFLISDPWAYARSRMDKVRLTGRAAI